MMKNKLILLLTVPTWWLLCQMKILISFPKCKVLIIKLPLDFLRYHPVIDGNLTNSTQKDLPYEASTPKRSKRILATRSSGRMPKIHGMNWENERFKIKINDRRAAFNCCFSGYEQGGPNSEIKNKASGWLMSIYWARRSCDDIIKSLEGTIHCE